MRDYIFERVLDTADYIIRTKATVRETAKHFGLSKSTVHKDATERLERANKALFLQVRTVLEYNKAERHIRGGRATHLKYRGGNPPKG